jgi:hypothetical protein
MAARRDDLSGGCRRGCAGGVGEVELPDDNPELNNNGEELENVDVKCLRVEGGLVEIMGVVPTHAGGEGRVSVGEITQRESPHVVEFLQWRPATQSVGGGVREDGERRTAGNQETDGA